jgi:hypothetical protein
MQQKRASNSMTPVEAQELMRDYRSSQEAVQKEKLEDERRQAWHKIE